MPTTRCTMINPDHIRIAFDGSSYWIERKILTMGPHPDDLFRKRLGVLPVWKHVYGYVGEDGWWTEDLKEDSSNEGVFVRRHYHTKRGVLDAVRALCTHITYFDVHGEPLTVASDSRSPYIMDESAKKHYEEREKIKRT